MQENYSKYLISQSKKFAKKNKIFDIVLYGSATKGKSKVRDIDILIIFTNESLRVRTNIAQELKEILREKIESLDIKTINLNELFQNEFLARQSILIESVSLIDNKPIATKLGFKGYSIFNYKLTNLNHNEKTKFTYALIGRNSEGILKKLKAEKLGKGALLIPIENSITFEEFLTKWKINFKSQNILIPKY